MPRLTQVWHCILVAVVVVAGAPDHALAQGGLSVSYTLATAAPTVNEPVFVKFTVYNGRSAPVVADLAMNSHGYGGFQGKLTRPDARTEDGPTVTPGEWVPRNRVSIAPDETFTMLLPINKWFDFDVPGRYFLEIGTRKALTTEAGLELPALTGGNLEIEVGPREPARLKRICADLEGRALNSQAPGWFEAAETLSHIHDPVAVPYLARLLGTRDDLTYVLAEGLERIGDGPAVDALLAHANDGAEDRRNAVRSALAVIESKTHDPEILRKIQDSRR